MGTATRAQAAGRAKRFGVVLALLYVFLWASAFVPSKILSTEGQPLWMLVARFLLAGGVLVVIALAAHRPFPTQLREWLELLLLGLLTNALYLGLAYISLEHLSSGMGAILSSTNPLILALLAPRLLGEPLSLRKGAGLLLGFGGVVAIMLERAGTGTARPLDVATMTLGVIAGVLSTVLFKRIQHRHDLVAAMATQLTCAGLVLIPAAFLLEGPLLITPTPELLASLAYLVVIVSVAASLLWFWLLTHGEASRVSAFYFLTPAFGLALGALLLGEHLVVRDLFGLTAIALGISLVQRG
ncbi:DMT family transporter [bacterium]|nr:MAG: DMT family transporter [bacterium]